MNERNGQWLVLAYCTLFIMYVGGGGFDNVMLRD